MYRGNPIRTLLTIAGSDNTGGAGIQADIKTSTAFRVHAASVITAVTAQDPDRVRNIETVTPEVIAAQIDAVYSCMTPDAIKIGMLPDVDTVKIVAQKIQEHHSHNVVMDPVLAASTGDSLTGGETSNTLRAMKEMLFPFVSLLTPNLPEAFSILGIDEKEYGKNGKYRKEEEITKTLKEATGVSAVLLKGGHSEGSYSTDILYNGNEFFKYCQSRIDTPNTHGTGCVLSSAIACGLAKGFTLPKAVRMAKDFITHALQNSINLNICRGKGPLYLFTR